MLENSKKVHFLVPEKAKMASLKTPKIYIIRGQKMPKCVSLWPLLTQKGLSNIRYLKTPKRCNFWHQKKPKYGHLRPLLTPKRLQVPENSKKVHFLVPEKANMCERFYIVSVLFIITLMGYFLSRNKK